jgi:hypothetical protein
MSDQGTEITQTKPALAKIASAFTRYANFTLGGGSATVAVLHRELLEKKRWRNSDNFSLCFAPARLTPGTNLLSFCTGVGWLLRGMSGQVGFDRHQLAPCRREALHRWRLIRSALISYTGRIGCAGRPLPHWRSDSTF